MRAGRRPIAVRRGRVRGDELHRPRVKEDASDDGWRQRANVEETEKLRENLPDRRRSCLDADAAARETVPLPLN